MAIDEKLKHLSSFLNEDIYELVTEYIASCASSQQEMLISYLMTYSELLCEHLNNKDIAETSLSLSYIRTHICKRNIFTGARKRFSYLLDLVTHLVKKGWFDESTSLPKRIGSATNHASYKAEVIPVKVLKKIKISPRELFNNILSSCCSPEISQRIKKYLNSFDTRHIYRHKKPLMVFLSQVSESNSKWYESPSIIQNELQKYNENLNINTINKEQTPLAKYTKVTNILADLITHGLLPQATRLPIYKHKPRENIDQRSSEQHTDSLESNLKHLSSFLNDNVYESVAEHVRAQDIKPKKQKNLVNDLMVYIAFISNSLNSNDVAETSLRLAYIRNHICQKLCFTTASQRFLNILQLANHLVVQGLLEESISLPKRIENVAEYKSYNAMAIPKDILGEFALPPFATELFDNALKACCSPEIANVLIKHVKSCGSKAPGYYRAPLVAFLNQVSASHSEWYNHSSIIINELQKYNEDLNTRNIKSRPTSRSQYINVKNALSVLIEHSLLPKDTHLPKYKGRTAKRNSCRTSQCSLTASVIDEKLKHMFSSLNDDIYELIVGHVLSRAIKPRQQRELVNDLVTYTELLYEPLNNNDAEVTSLNLGYIYTHVCQTYAFEGAKKRIEELLLLVEYLIQKSLFEEPHFLPKTLLSIAEYEFYKTLTIPKKVLDKIAIKISAQELFDNALSSYCPPAIAKRLAEHVNSFKAKERKSHRKPLIEFLNQVSASHSKWYEHPITIQSELLKYRGNLLDKLNRNTAYRNFQNVKNAISVLIEHALLPKDTELPYNLKINTNTDKVRKENPLIAQIDLYDDKLKQTFINTPTFIKDLKNELSDNLRILVEEAQTIVYEGYHKFLAKDDLVARSQRDEYINHPELLVNSAGPRNGINPFEPLHPLYKENIVAYYDYYFDIIVKNKKPHKKTGLKFGQEVIEYFGLTPLVSSAMQIIITEELGINPYSLYNAKVSSDGHGHEFVLVDDEDNVRIRVLKARARNIRTKKAEGTSVHLSKIDARNINAAACLKMALEMGARARESQGIDSLWTCLTYSQEAGVPRDSTFQYHFNTIREQASSKSESEALKVATLKKVRCSKGVLIYLETNGDSLKTATYLGNQVKTALLKYIPKYLSELIYRIKIRSFQNILLFMAVASDTSPYNSLNMSEKEFKINVKQAFSNPDMGGRLFKKLTNPESTKKTDNTIYFCVSDNNLKLAIEYAQSGSDETIKANCINVLSKIAEGPVLMKQMLRKAQKAVQGNI